MAEGVSGRLRSSGAKAATVTVKVRDTTFRTVTRQTTLPSPTDLTEPIFKAALTLARSETRGRKIRLVGVTASGLERGEQLGLFEAEAARRHRIAEAQDELRQRFGERAVTRARLLGSRLPAPFERDFGTAVERRGIHAEDQARDPRRPGSRRIGSGDPQDTSDGWPDDDGGRGLDEADVSSGGDDARDSQGGTGGAEDLSQDA
jgi:nucleotidyltransferase/DNA polymerase involved in DNA repair